MKSCLTILVALALLSGSIPAFADPHLVSVSPDSMEVNDTLTVTITGEDVDFRFQQASGTTEIWLQKDNEIIAADHISTIQANVLTALFDAQDAETGLWDLHVEIIDPEDEIILIDSLAEAFSIYNITRYLVPQQFETIDAAILASDVNDTIIVSPGTYQGAAFRNRKIILASMYLLTNDEAYIDSTIINSTVIFNTNETRGNKLIGFTISGAEDSGIKCYEESNPTISNCIIKNNSSIISGGGIKCLSGSNPLIEDCLFIENRAPRGGGVCVQNSSPDFINCTFINNEATLNGGAASIEISGSPIFSSCEFSNNRANEEGGAINIQGRINAQFESCFFSANHSNGSGGGLYIENLSSPFFESCVITENTASNYGGGITVNRSTPTFIDCEISLCESNFGGGIFLSYDARPLFNSCIIIENNSVRAGGIQVQASGGEFYSCTIQGNIASEVAGGIYLYQGSTTEFDSCEISENEAPVGGGIYYNLESNPVFVLCNVVNNLSTDGGAIYISASTGLFDKCLISGNNASQNGGGIFVADEGAPQLKYCEISGNSAQTGSALVSRQSNTNLINCTISRNEPANDGCGIYFVDNSSGNLRNCIIWENGANEILFSDSAGLNNITVHFTDIRGGIDGIETNNNGEITWGEGNINQDPMFLDPDNYDFHLTPGTPCFNAGDPASPRDPDNTRADMGAYYLDLAGIDEDVNIPELFRFSAYPNPFNSPTTITYSVGSNSNSTNLSLYDLSGRLVQTLVEGRLTPGNYRTMLNANGLAAGVYMLKLSNGKESQVQKVLLLK